MTVQLDNARIGFIGTGVMGSSMAKHLQQGGYKLSIYTRTKAKAQELLDLGMEWKASPGELAAECDVVITMVGYPSDVRALYLGEDRVIDHARPGTYLIDMTTSSPLLAKQIYESACLKGLHALDAPVSGEMLGQGMGRYPSWWEEMTKRSTPSSRSLNRWATASYCREVLEPVNTRRW